MCVGLLAQNATCAMSCKNDSSLCESTKGDAAMCDVSLAALNINSELVLSNESPEDAEVDLPIVDVSANGTGEASAVEDHTLFAQTETRMRAYDATPPATQIRRQDAGTPPKTVEEHQVITPYTRREGLADQKVRDPYFDSDSDDENMSQTLDGSKSEEGFVEKRARDPYWDSDDEDEDASSTFDGSNNEERPRFDVPQNREPPREEFMMEPAQVEKKINDIDKMALSGRIPFDDIISVRILSANLDLMLTSLKELAVTTPLVAYLMKQEEGRGVRTAVQKMYKKVQTVAMKYKDLKLKGSARDSLMRKVFIQLEEIRKLMLTFKSLNSNSELQLKRLEMQRQQLEPLVRRHAVDRFNNQPSPDWLKALRMQQEKWTEQEKARFFEWKSEQGLRRAQAEKDAIDNYESMRALREQLSTVRRKLAKEAAAKRQRGAADGDYFNVDLAVVNSPEAEFANLLQMIEVNKEKLKFIGESRQESFKNALGALSNIITNYMEVEAQAGADWRSLAKGIYESQKSENGDLDATAEREAFAVQSIGDLFEQAVTHFNAVDSNSVKRLLE